MPGALSDSTDLTAARPAAITFAPRVRLAMVLMGYIPLLHILGVTAAGWITYHFAARWTLPVVLLGIYAVPPLACRSGLMILPVRPGRHAICSSQFLHWWFSAQWQVLFNRLPMLEELLRLIPSLYSLWLRCWGGKIGGLVYWSPGTVILDRPFVQIGRRVVFGAGVRVNPHVMMPAGEGPQIWIAPVEIGDEALVGGYALLLAGVRVPAGASIAPLRAVRPFTVYRQHSSSSAAGEEAE